jgi:hypothetical protein
MHAGLDGWREAAWLDRWAVYGYVTPELVLQTCLDY